MPKRERRGTSTCRIWRTVPEVVSWGSSVDTYGPSTIFDRRLPRAVDAISFGDSAVVYEGCWDGGEGEEVFGLAFVAAVETSASG